MNDAAFAADAAPWAKPPIRYTPDLERVAPDEAETIRQLVAEMRKISEKMVKRYDGHAVRSVHAKSHGVLEGRLSVLPGLPPELAQGLFAQPRQYAVRLRLSTTPGDILDDSVSTPRGVSIKVLDAPGERLEGSEGSANQDFVLVNSPTFQAPSPKAFLQSLKLLEATADVPQAIKKVVSGAARGANQILGMFGAANPLLSGLGYPETHILGETFFSSAPIRYGDHVAKVMVAPVSPALKALTDAPLNVNGKPNGLREAVKAYFAEQEAEWEVRIQLNVDPEAMPIEDASVPWPEALSPYVAVARLTAPAQDSWSDAAVQGLDEGMSFSPWHGVEAHRPLGGVMRARKPAYEMSERFRAEHNGGPITDGAVGAA